MGNFRTLQLFPLLSKVQRSCAGQDMFGVQLCAEAQVPDIPSLRLQQLPVLSAFGQTDVRLSMEPSSDKPASIQLTGVVKNDEKGQRDEFSGYLLRIPDTNDIKQRTKTMKQYQTEFSLNRKKRGLLFYVICIRYTKF